jgi:FtsH-binding integral membrane protein
MRLKHWIPTFVAFPIGGFIASEAIGSLDGPAPAAAGGLIVGAVIGAAQWLALRPRVDGRWAGATAAAMAAGAALAAIVTGADATTGDVVAAGAITGAAVGAAQAALLGGGARVTAGWTAITSASWGLGWLITAQVIVDLDRGHHVFGASGAIVVTLVTGVALRLLLDGARPAALVAR